MVFRCVVLALLLVTVPIGAAAAPASQQIRRAVLQSPLRDIRLYRGCTSNRGFVPKSMAALNTPEDLARAVGSRLMSTSNHVSGFTSSPQTAGCFALGVKDRDPNTVRIYGSSKGYVGVTKGRVMSAGRFVELLDQHRRSLPKLLQAMGECKVVVDASSLTQRLGDRYPGILTRGFREMINSALQREAEYLSFGREPRFSRVVEVSKDDLVRRDGISITFASGLTEKLGQPAVK